MHFTICEFDIHIATCRHTNHTLIVPACIALNESLVAFATCHFYVFIWLPLFVLHWRSSIVIIIVVVAVATAAKVCCYCCLYFTFAHSLSVSVTSSAAVYVWITLNVYICECIFAFISVYSHLCKLKCVHEHICTQCISIAVGFNVLALKLNRQKFKQRILCGYVFAFIVDYWIWGNSIQDTRERKLAERRKWSACTGKHVCGYVSKRDGGGGRRRLKLEALGIWARVNCSNVQQ